MGIQPGMWAYEETLVLEAHEIYVNCIAKWTKLLSVTEQYELTQATKKLAYNEGSFQRRIRRSPLLTGDSHTVTVEQNKTVANESVQNKTAVIDKQIIQVNENITITRDIINDIMARNAEREQRDYFRLWQKYYPSLIKNNTDIIRPKRGAIKEFVKDAAVGVLKDGLAAFVGGLGANIVTDLFKFAYEYLDPNSNTNRLTRMEHKFNSMIDKVQLHEEILERIINATSDLAERTELLKYKIASTSHNDKMLYLIRSEVDKALDKADESFRKLIVSRLSGTVSMEALAKLTDEDEWLKYDSKFCDLDNVKVLPKDHNNLLTIMIAFQIKELAKDTYVAKIFAFKHWGIKSDPARLMEYDGADYLIFNETSHCAKAIDRPYQKTVFDSCDRTGYLDDNLQKWRVIKEAVDPRLIPMRSALTATLKWVYTYCFPNTIEVWNQTQGCPNAVIRLPITTIFKLPDHPRWDPGHRAIAKVLRAGEVLDYVPTTQANEKEH
jgi:hypothetical protein